MSEHCDRTQSDEVVKEAVVRAIEIISRGKVNRKSKRFHIDLTDGSYSSEFDGFNWSPTEPLVVELEVGKGTKKKCMEKWRIRYEKLPGKGGLAELQHAFKRISLSLRVLYSFARLLPAHQALQQEKEYVHVKIITAPHSLVMVKEDERAWGFQRFQTVRMSFGQLFIDVEYLKDVPTARSKRKTSIPPNVIIQDYVPKEETKKLGRIRSMSMARENDCMLQIQSRPFVTAPIDIPRKAQDGTLGADYAQAPYSRSLDSALHPKHDVKRRIEIKRMQDRKGDDGKEKNKPKMTREYENNSHLISTSTPPFLASNVNQMSGHVRNQLDGQCHSCSPPYPSIPMSLLSTSPDPRNSHHSGLLKWNKDDHDKTSPRPITPGSRLDLSNLESLPMSPFKDVEKRDGNLLQGITDISLGPNRIGLHRSAKLDKTMNGSTSDFSDDEDEPSSTDFDGEGTSYECEQLPFAFASGSNLTSGSGNDGDATIFEERLSTGEGSRGFLENRQERSAIEALQLFNMFSDSQLRVRESDPPGPMTALNDELDSFKRFISEVERNGEERQSTIK